MAQEAPPENPPPYKSSPTSQADDILEPGLKFDSETILSNLHKSDQAFAREVVREIARCAQLGIFSHHAWGCCFTEPSVFLSLVVTDGDRKLKRKLSASKSVDGIRGLDLMLTRIENDIMLLRNLRERI